MYAYISIHFLQCQIYFYRAGLFAKSHNSRYFGSYNARTSGSVSYGPKCIVRGVQFSLIVWFVLLTPLLLRRGVNCSYVMSACQPAFPAAVSTGRYHMPPLRFLIFANFPSFFVCFAHNFLDNPINLARLVHRTDFAGMVFGYTKFCRDSFI